MLKVDVSLCMIQHVRSFIAIVNKYGFAMDLRSGKHVVDARSILGIFSLDMSRPLELEIKAGPGQDDKLNNLISELKPFIASGAQVIYC